jgi:2-C-methyl-D-erythritol 4-phosphate cytidylyltransferase
MRTVTTAAVVPAAGRGERLGPGTPKALRRLGGVPLLVHSVRALARARGVDVVVVAAPPGGVVEVRTLLADHDAGADVQVVAGRRHATAVGAPRPRSPSRPGDVVLVHDAARPLVPVELVDAVVAAVRGGADAVVPALPVADTIKVVSADGHVAETLDRAVLRAVQTPQGFRRTVLEAAHLAAGDLDATDDAGLVERAGGTVLVVPGAEEAFKVTRPIDLELAEAVLARRRTQHVR